MTTSSPMVMCPRFCEMSFAPILFQAPSCQRKSAARTFTAHSSPLSAASRTSSRLKGICHPTREHHDTDRAADLDQSEALSASTCGLGAAGAFRATLGFDQNEFSFSLGWAWFWETQGPAGEQGPFCVKHPKNHVKPNETRSLTWGHNPSSLHVGPRGGAHMSDFRTFA